MPPIGGPVKQRGPCPISRRTKQLTPSRQALGSEVQVNMFRSHRAVLLVLALIACTAIHPVTSAPTPISIQAYLDRHPDAAVQVIDTLGRGRWIYDARVHGDTLLGVGNTSPPWDPIALPFSQIRDVRAPRFSMVRTAGLLGGVVAIVGVTALSA